MGLYLDEGYVNIPYILNQGMTFNFCVGGRGTGKTYGALKYIIMTGKKFMLMRRTQSQLDLINKDEFSPFKVVARDMGLWIQSKSISKYNAGIYLGERDLNGEIEFDTIPAGYTAALSTISNLRGFDASDVEIIIYDEFIPEKHEKPIKEEGAAFLNAYETINRNRELNGQPPVRVLCLANSNNLGNAIFMELGIVQKAEQMKRKGQEMSIIPDRGIGLFMLDNSPISVEKKSTVLYKLAQMESDFARMALGNKFAEITALSTGHRDLKEYRPIVTMGELTAYRHKSKAEYYISHHRSGTPPAFTVSDIDRSRCYRHYSYLWEAYMRNNIIFEDSTAEIYFVKYFE